MQKEKSMKSKKTLLSILFIMAGIFYSCQNPDGSPNPGPVPPLVTGVKASCLHYSDRIRVTWNHAEGAESYKVYRYLHKKPGFLDDVFPSTTNIFEDTDASADTPYFYKVVSVIDSKTSELSANYVKGIYSTMVDTFEPNDDKPQAGEVPAGETGWAPAAPNAVIYSFSEGEAQDIDWYTYTGEYSLVNIKVLLPGGSQFDGKLTLRIENGNSYKILVTGENELGYSGKDLTFSIEVTVPNADIDATGIYTVYLELIAPGYAKCNNYAF
jgi:hypothetical protein